jgi:glycine/D-amino acid oxidase-like deaminating enzyme
MALPLNPTENTDFIIVGQGLAGTLLAYFLLLENQQVIIIDAPISVSSSSVAAGVINPVTGRRIAKSWRFEEFYPFAKKTYLELEEILGISLWKERNVLRALPTVFDENEWLRRSAFPEYEPYIQEPCDLETFAGKIRPVRSWGELKQCAQVAMPALISAFREKLRTEGVLREEIFDYQQVNTNDSFVLYKGIQARKLIFCEGARAVHNPFFQYLPFVVTKGELLLVQIPGAGFEKMLKHHVFIVPVAAGMFPSFFSPPEKDCYWVGSTSRFEFEDELPSAEQGAWLEEQLNNVLQIPFKVVAHLSAIRPTVYDIRPFLGAHSSYSNLLIFNGLGTKGASMAPFFAKQMCDYLQGKGALDGEVDIRRFAHREYPR